MDDTNTKGTGRNAFDANVDVGNSWDVPVGKGVDDGEWKNNGGPRKEYDDDLDNAG